MIAEIGRGWLVRLLEVGHYLILLLVQRDGVTFGRPFPLCAAFFICEKEEQWLYRLVVVCCTDGLDPRIKILLLSSKFNKESVSTEAVITGG